METIVTRDKTQLFWRLLTYAHNPESYPIWLLSKRQALHNVLAFESIGQEKQSHPGT